MNKFVGYLLLVLIVTIVIFIMKRSFGNRKCASCQVGRMERAKLESQGVSSMHMESNQQGGGLGAKAIFRVTYQCSHCKEKWVTTEHH